MPDHAVDFESLYQKFIVNRNQTKFYSMLLFEEEDQEIANFVEFGSGIGL